MSTEQVIFQTQIEGLTAQLTGRERQIVELQTANEELERAARVKDDLLATMGHELRTPLNAVLSLSRVLQEQLG
ncbi:MAG TPA: histidine kinase dimerization/phospho-acceptor domain-containing protein, partial [Caldilinea sp.]|nr:histidine kinase dimerization/phospho-acceptor domain-containing protein [Caldilinea sp.]